MKKLMVTLTLAALLAFPLTALAKDKHSGGGFQAEGSGGFADNKTTVAQALKMKDDTWVVLSGTIVKQLEKDKYQFSDASGVITVEIDDQDWGGLVVGPKDMVEIQGEVDREFKGTEIDVKKIRKL